MANGLSETEAIYFAADVVISRQTAHTSIPRRFTKTARDIWQMQSRLQRRNLKNPERLLTHPRFRAAYDFLLLRAQAGENVAEAADRWTRLQENPEIAATKKKSNHRKRNRRSGKPAKS